MGPADAHFLAEQRPRLVGLAYRILGSWADAEDAVQDTLLKWEAARREEIECPAAWLTTACTRRAIDMLRAAHRTRVDYVGAWLPEPVPDAAVAAVSDADLGATLTTAFLLVLERLSPKERAAFLLREVFEMDYPAVAATLAMTEPACRKLVSRARGRIGGDPRTQPAARSDQAALVGIFRRAVETGDVSELAARLAEDARITADGGGVVPALGRELRGREAVLGYVSKRLHLFWHGAEWQPIDLNGTMGLAVRKDADLVAAVTFDVDAAGRLAGIFIMRNPHKLHAVRAALG